MKDCKKTLTMRVSPGTSSSPSVNERLESARARAALPAHPRHRQGICPRGKPWLQSALALAGLLLAAGCSKRMGHNVEDITLIQEGPLAGHIAVLDGYDVYLSNTRMPGREVEKAFGLGKTGISGGPRGIAYLPEEQHFVFTNPRKPGYLLRTDLHGNEVDPLVLSYPEDYRHYHSEGLTYLPKSAPKYGGKILMIGVQLEPEFRCRIFVFDTDGSFVDEIVLNDDLHTEWIATLAYDHKGGLWISQGDNRIHHYDLQGNRLQEPVAVPDANSLEGIAAGPEGRVYVGDLFDGRIRALNEQLERQSQEDRAYSVGLGATFPLALTWRSDIKRIAMLHLVPNGFRVVDTPVGLEEVKEEFILEKDSTYQSSMTWLEAEGLYGILRAASGELWLVDRHGVKHDSLDLSEHMPILAVDYLPSRNRFVILSGQVGSDQELRILGRDGAQVGEFTLAELSGVSHAVSMASYEFRGKAVFVVADAPEQGTSLTAFDLSGSRYWSMDYRKELGVVYPANMTSIDADIMPSMAVSDPGSSKIAVFSHPCGE